MRALLLFVWLAMPAWALAKPTLAVAPIEGDRDGKVAELVVEAASDDYKVVEPGKVGDTMSNLDIEEIDGKSVKRLRKKLGAEIVVYGKIEKDGKTKTLSLSVSARGKRTSKFEIEYRSADAKSFKRELRGELGQRIATAERDESNDDDDDDEGRDRGRKKRRDAADDDDDDDDDDRKSKKKLKRHPVTHAAVRLSGGAAAARRTLTWDATGTNVPPSVGTFGPAGRIDAELYPFAFDKLSGAAALGLYAEIEKAFGVGIDVPMTAVTSSIDQMRYSIGARYRIVFGTTSLALGASYWHRRYVADRSMLATPATLDTPDVKYSAVAPTAVLRFASGNTIGAYASLEIPLMLSTGPIQASTQYGPANVIAFDLEAGAEILLGARYGVRLAANFEQVGITFDRKPGSMSEVRGVSSATDRLVGLTATLAIVY